jgi:hypothetical protein
MGGRRISDSGGSYLKKVEIWRAPYNSSNCSDTVKTGCVWSLRKSLAAPLSSNTWSSSTTTSVNKGTSYWFGFHVIDNAGNAIYEPYMIKVTPTTITIAQTADKSALFSRDLTYGSNGSDVSTLQKLLVNEVQYSANLITGFFGRKTQESVKRFQAKYGIDPTGYVGARTRERLKALIMLEIGEYN